MQDVKPKRCVNPESPGLHWPGITQFRASMFDELPLFLCRLGLWFGIQELKNWSLTQKLNKSK